MQPSKYSTPNRFLNINKTANKPEEMKLIESEYF